MTKDDAKQSMQELKEEFLAQLPKYEGMSQEEKGLLIAEAGLRVMAGQSSNAITNIATGLKGLGPELAKGAKEKREWNRQVELSAAKYALQTTKTNRAEDLALAKEGRIIKKGTAFPATENQLRNGILERYPLTYLETYRSDAKDLLALVKAGQEGRVPAKSFSETQTKYENTLDSYKSSLNMKIFLRESARLAADGNVLGAKGFIGQKLDRALNAIGIQGNEEQAAWMEEYRSTDKSKYDANQKRLGVAMATELLREGSKTLSDNDRKRVEELIADLVGKNGVFISEDVLKAKLLNLERVIDDNITKSAASLAATEFRWAKETTKGGQELGGILPTYRQRVLGESRTTVGGNSTYLLSDIYDIKQKKFNKSFLTPTPRAG